MCTCIVPIGCQQPSLDVDLTLPASEHSSRALLLALPPEEVCFGASRIRHGSFSFFGFVFCVFAGECLLIGATRGLVSTTWTSSVLPWASSVRPTIDSTTRTSSVLPRASSVRPVASSLVSVNSVHVEHVVEAYRKWWSIAYAPPTVVSRRCRT